MKRIIALALSILLGSTGYVIVDHTIEDRVGVLESQVESLNGVVSSLEDKHTAPTTSYEFAIGENIPVTDTQKYTFDMIHYTAYESFDGETGEKLTVIRGKDNVGGYGDADANIEHINDFKLNINELKFECISIDSIPTTTTTTSTTTTTTTTESTTTKSNNTVATSKNPISTVTTTTTKPKTTVTATKPTVTTAKPIITTKTTARTLMSTATLPYPNQRKFGIKATCTGTVPVDYAGKTVLFELKADNHSSFEEAKSFTAIIEADGSFTFIGYFVHREDMYDGLSSCSLIDPVIC